MRPTGKRSTRRAPLGPARGHSLILIKVVRGTPPTPATEVQQRFERVADGSVLAHEHSAILTICDLAGADAPGRRHGAARGAAPSAEHGVAPSASAAAHERGMTVSTSLLALANTVRHLADRGPATTRSPLAPGIAPAADVSPASVIDAPGAAAQAHVAGLGPSTLRDCALTRLLRASLGGACKTTFLATVSQVRHLPCISAAFHRLPWPLLSSHSASSASSASSACHDRVDRLALPWCHVACPPHPTSLGATWQVSTHKDSREMALADADKWQTRYAELKREYDEAVLAAAEAAGRHEASSAELRSEARLKSFEAERLRMQTEQAMVSARQAAVDAEAKGEKLELLKSEYYSLKTASATKIAQLEASSAALTARIGTYEALEEELDRTVLQAGAIAAIESGGGADGGGGEGGGHGMQPYLRVPSSAQRRMQQCLTLAKDLLTTQRRAETSEAKLLEAMGEAERLQTVVEELQRRVRQGGQPQSYLVQQVESAEATRIETEAKLAVVTQQLAEHEEALAAARAQNEQLLTDLESLLSQRGSLDALRATLTRLLPLEMLPALAPQIA